MSQMSIIPDSGVLKLVEGLKEAYCTFTWESAVWAEKGHKRSPYRALVLFGLSARTRDSLLVSMCQEFFERFPHAETLAMEGETVSETARATVRVGQLPIIVSMSEVLVDGVPRDKDGLTRIKGVGEKISECVLAYGWGEEALPLDANCVRVLSRVFGLQAAERSPGPLREVLKSVYRRRRLDFANMEVAMVDVHEILRLHGQILCRRTPDCAHCPIAGCVSRRKRWDESSVSYVSPNLWNDWRDLINEPGSI